MTASDQTPADGTGHPGSPTPLIGARPADIGTSSARIITSVSALDAVEKPRHRWYFFKEAFSPEVVNKAIADANCRQEDLVVDPFCGSGTVPVEATLSGHTATGLEVNPFLAFVARAKLIQCRPNTFEARAEDVLAPARRGRRSPLADFSTFSETAEQGRKQQKWLFNRSVLDSFEGAWRAIGGSRTAAQSLVRLCLLGAATDVCNAVKDGKGLRYPTNWRERAYNGADFIAAFEERVSEVAEDLRRSPLEPHSSSVQLTDSRQKAPTKNFKLCITSPPYLNSFDYTDVYRPELFLGKWVTSMKELRALRLRTLRSHVQVEWEEPTEEDFGLHYSEIIGHLRPRKAALWNQRIPLMVQAYFEDMRRVLTHLRSAAHEAASAWIVVSTSAYAGVEIPVDLIIADIGSACGWYLREVTVLRHLGRVAGQQWKELSDKKANAKPHLRESLIILDASPHGNHR